METNIDKVSASECDSLALNDNIDGYHQFSWPPAASGKTQIKGAYISLPQISHGLKLFINEQPVLNAKLMVDIGPFLRNGSNSVVAVVPTLMWNYISSIYQDIEI
ncbi:hypothetical protein VI817_004090 [Penicillium citrinum]|uniref:Uncharacterized protein n=1 Tax=Penicillium hetheringtonii TaxID=911720 RepID=A0AAD6DX57_9EURO|nr:hypothetical protein N7450_003098 [Penicillium hetheringtonii]KAK5797799.1 hypothetical protein VI817_004090 [Penicillium citrinum]